MTQTAKITSKPVNEPIGLLNGEPVFASPELQIFLDDLVDLKLNVALFAASVLTPTYTAAQVTPLNPALIDAADPTKNLDGMICVSNETGGRTLATSDGTNWRRVSDGAIVS